MKKSILIGFLSLFAFGLFQNCTSEKGIGEAVGEKQVEDGLDLASTAPSGLSRIPLTNETILTTSLSVDGSNATALQDIIHYGGTTGVENDADLGQVYSTEAGGTILSAKYLLVDTSKTYVVRGMFKSVGETLSRLYFGVSPYDSNGRFVGSEQVLRYGNPVRFLYVNGLDLSVDQEPVGWQQTPTIAYARVLGVYYDGNTDKLPDAVINDANGNYDNTADTGAYSSTSGSSIRLVRSLPLNVLSRINSSTVFMNHSHGGTYLYSSAAFSEVPAEWTEFTGTITGEGFGNLANVFRPTTRYVRLMILPNYGQGAGSKLLMDDFTITEQ